MERLTIFDGEFWGHKRFLEPGGDTVGEFIDCVKELAERLASIEDILGDEYDLDRLRKLLEADRDGRCVALPCKVGDIVYVIGAKKVVKSKIQDVTYSVSFECDNYCEGCPFDYWNQSWDGEWSCDGGYGDGSVKQREFGKTVFLTPEEAQAALERMERNE